MIDGSAYLGGCRYRSLSLALFTPGESRFTQILFVTRGRVRLQQRMPRTDYSLGTRPVPSVIDRLTTMDLGHLSP